MAAMLLAGSKESNPTTEMALMQEERKEGEELEKEAMAEGVAAFNHEASADTCSFWVARKRRMCCNKVKPGHRFCGNHLPSNADKRVPCPLDPSHSVVESDVSTHILRCPTAKRQLAALEQPYFKARVNADSDDEGEALCSEGQLNFDSARHSNNGNNGDIIRIGDVETVEVEVRDCGGEEERLDLLLERQGGVVRDKDKAKRSKGNGYESRMEKVVETRNEKAVRNGKRATVLELKEVEFWRIVKKIEAAYERNCSEPRKVVILRPKECDDWLGEGRRRDIPFSEKHAIQQASILGNMAAIGLLKPVSEKMANGEAPGGVGSEPVYVEFGAGRGYLSHMMWNCYGAKRFVMIEREGYKFKADRSMKKGEDVEMTRLRIDIADLQLSGIPALQGRPFVAMSKHLCGAATDLTLRCCFKNMCDEHTQLGLPSDGPEPENQKETMCERGGGESPLRGLAIATCCHHLCEWQSYVNKSFFRDQDFSPSEFDILTWFTSWAILTDSEDRSCDLQMSSHGSHPTQEHEQSMETVPPAANLAVTSTSGYIPRLAPCDNGELKLSPMEPVHGGGAISFDVLAAMEASEKVRFGLKCKRLLDAGRTQWLLQRGLRAQVVEYIERRVSPENGLLLGWWK